MPITRKLTDNIEETVQLIYEGLYSVLDAQPRERLLKTLQLAQEQYLSKSWRTARLRDFKQLVSELKTVPFKEENLSNFIQHFNEFVIHKSGGLKFSSANTLILHALAEEYACQPSEHAKSTSSKGGFRSMTVFDFTKEVAPLLREHLKRKVSERTPMLESKPTIKVPSKLRVPQLAVQKKICFVMTPTKATPAILAECLDKTHRLANERHSDYICLVDANTVSWCPPGGDRLIPLPMSSKKMAEFLAANDETKSKLIYPLIDTDELEQCKVYFNKDTETFSDEELRKNPYVFHYNSTQKDMRLIRLDIRGREIHLPVSDLLRDWVIEQYSKPENEKLTVTQFLNALRPWLCGLSLPQAKPLQAELCRTAEKALQNQLSIYIPASQSTSEQNQPKKLSAERYSAAASIFGGASEMEKKRSLPEIAFLTEVEKTFGADIPPAPPYPFGK